MRNGFWRRVSVALAVWCLCFILGQAAASYIEAKEHGVSFWDAMFIESWKK